MQTNCIKTIDDITVIDMNRFADMDTESRQHISDLFIQTMATEGLIGFEGHPACNSGIDLSDLGHRLFSLPLEKYQSSGMAATRGFSRGALDQLMWHTGPEISADNPLFARLPPNQWLDELPDFKTVSLEMFSLLEDLSLDMMSMLAIGLKANEKDWLAAMQNHSSVLRFIYFPANGELASENIRLVEHIDAGLFAIIPPADGGGFEVYRNGDWFSVPSYDDIIFTYPGQMTEYLTNGKIKAVSHRVTSHGYREHSRLSFPYFMMPHPDFKLAAPESLIDAAAKEDYPEYTAEELLLRYFQEYLPDNYDSGWARQVTSE